MTGQAASAPPTVLEKVEKPVPSSCPVTAAWLRFYASGGGIVAALADSLAAGGWDPRDIESARGDALEIHLWGRTIPHERADESDQNAKRTAEMRARKRENRRRSA